MAPPLGGCQLTSGPSTTDAPVTTREYVVRIPKPAKRDLHLMRFREQQHHNKLDWTNVTMRRQNNLKDHQTECDELPKFGAGSEFGREFKDEARRRKYGIMRKKYVPNNQPWQLQLGGKSGKTYRGVREGGINENASYYIFFEAPDGAFEAHPLDQWYNFAPVQTYKTLNAEEAEDAFNKRDKIMNHFAVMVQKRLAEAEGKDIDEIGQQSANFRASTSKPKGDRNRLKLSDMDDSVARSDSSGADSESDETEEAFAKKKKKRRSEKKKDKKSQESDTSAKEDSDQGDFEHREVDYITSGSESSDEDPEDVRANKQMKGVEDEDAIRQLVLSDEDETDEDDQKKNEENDKSDGGDKAKESVKKNATTLHESGKSTDEKGNSKCRGNKGQKRKIKAGETSDDTSSSSSDSDIDDTNTAGSRAIFMTGKNKRGDDCPPHSKIAPLAAVRTDEHKHSSKTTSKTGRFVAVTREGETTRRIEQSHPRRQQQTLGCATNATQHTHSANSVGQPPLKKIKVDPRGSLDRPGHQDRKSTAPTPAPCTSPPAAQTDGLSVENIRRYLLRKPMTTTDLLQKLKSKKGDLTSAQLVSVVTDILKRLNPEKLNINGKLHLFIKE